MDATTDAAPSIDPAAAATGDPGRVVIVGASLAGLRAAEALRAADYRGEVVVVGDEPHRPYDRPPLSKRLLSGEWEPERIALRQPDAFAELDVEWRLGASAEGLDVDARTVTLDGGETVAFDGVVIATGAICRRLPGQQSWPHVHEVRTLDDALRLRPELLAGGRRVAVIGAGFIGLEVAATARQLGNDVVVLEGAEAPLIRGLGAEMGAAVGALHVAEGVDVRCAVRVEELTAAGVRITADGRDEHLDADVVVVGIGVVPATDWLAGSGVAVADGVVCDATLNARRADGGALAGVYAAGDVLRWFNPLYGEEMRIEHWTNAAEQGAVAAENLLAVARGEAPTEYAPVPFFWSDQFRHRIQFLGRAAADDDVVVGAGSVADGKWLALYGRAGRLRGVLGVNAPRWVMPMRAKLLEGISMDDAAAHAATL